jgi:NADPH:quinone reductase-like Zn-dependent oxidoreductase
MVAPMQPTDYYGNPKGEPITIAEMADKATKEYLHKRPDAGYNRPQSPTNLEVAITKAAGATVISTSSSDEKLERLKTLGADHLINYRQTPEWGAAAAALTGGRGVDVVVEIGGAGTLAQSVTGTRIGGHVSLIGVLAGFAGEVPTALIMSKNVAVKGVTVGSRQEQEEMIRALEVSSIRPVIDSTFPLEGIAAAFAHQVSQKHFGKICLEF